MENQSQVLEIKDIKIVDDKFVLNDGEIVITITDENNEAFMNIDYKEGLYSEEQIKSLGNDFVRHLEEIIDSFKSAEATTKSS
jgi:hypothetical protein